LLIAAVSNKWLLGIVAIPSIMFLLITVAASLDLGRRYGWRHALLGPVAYSTIYVGLGAGMLSELLRFPGKQRIAPVVKSFQS